MKLKAKSSTAPYLALDLGDRFLGLAYSEAGILALGLQTIDRQGRSDDQIFRIIGKIIKKLEIQSLIVGLPISADGSENPHCQIIRHFVRNLENYLNCVRCQMSDVRCVPEDFSSIDASLLPKTKLSQKPKTSSHSQAAKIILERHLESQV